MLAKSSFKDELARYDSELTSYTFIWTVEDRANPHPILKARMSHIQRWAKDPRAQEVWTKIKKSIPSAEAQDFIGALLWLRDYPQHRCCKPVRRAMGHERKPASMIGASQHIFTMTSSFEQLRSNLINYPRVHVHKMGLSDRSGSQLFYSNMFAPTNSLLEPDPAADETWGKDVVRAKAVVECEFVALDEFVEKNNITRIDILKLDVQGSETEILNRARNALKNGIIALIYSEIITMPTYKGQQKLWQTLRAFDHHGMDLHNIYDLKFSNGRISQFDAIFVRRSSLPNMRS